MSDEPRTLVIGDVHGHLDRLDGLLRQEKILNHKGERIDHDSQVICTGDLGHFGGSSGSPTGDLMCWKFAGEGLIDIVLWGNHDRAVVDSTHHFGGYARPEHTINHIMRRMESQGRLKFAHASHGVLLTHAGLHAQWKFNPAPKGLNKDDAYEVADYINSLASAMGDHSEVESRKAKLRNRGVIDAVGAKRGGWSAYGGILWRDISEKLYDGFPQVFGHSASKEHIVRAGFYPRDKTGVVYTGDFPPGNEDWYCIDIGGKGGLDRQEAECLAGIWLPDRKVVRYDLITQGG